MQFVLGVLIGGYFVHFILPRICEFCFMRPEPTPGCPCGDPDCIYRFASAKELHEFLIKDWKGVKP
jgi:hypothetical protein